MSTFSDLCADYEHITDPDELADTIADALALNKRQREVLLPLIRNACWNADRGRVRRLEAKAQPTRIGRPVDPYERGRLLRDTFPLPGGARVTWGEATVEQHRQRIDMLRAQVGGLNTTIARHEVAIAELETSGATCLDELTTGAAA